jgi:hypothetical protein
VDNLWTTRWWVVVVVGLGLGLSWPGRLTAPPQTGVVVLAWDDFVNETQDGYLILRREDRAGTLYDVIAAVDAVTRQFTDQTVARNDRVCYVVEAFTNPGLVSGPSNEVCVRVRP